MLKENLYWNKIENTKNEFVLKSTKKEVAKLKFNNVSESTAIIETPSGNLDLHKTGFPNPTTIYISYSENELAKLIIRPSTTEAKIEFSNGDILDCIYFESTGECKFKANGIGSADIVSLKPILNGKETCIEVIVNSDKYSDKEIIAMSVLGMYLILVEFKNNLKGSLLVEILGFFGLAFLS